MLTKAETLDGTVQQNHGLQAHQTTNTYEAAWGRENTQGFEQLHDETLMIIRLLTTESPTFGAE